MNQMRSGGAVKLVSGRSSGEGGVGVWAARRLLTAFWDHMWAVTPAGQSGKDAGKTARNHL